MKKLLVITGFVSSLLIVMSCSDVRREPGRIYMPDMTYSRAYETYAPLDTNFTTDPTAWETNGSSKIFYNNLPVAGSVSRGEDYVYHIAKDKTGDSTNYVSSKQTVNPFQIADSSQLIEAERIYLINCAICHGTKLDGNGPLYKGGEGPYPAKPATLSGADAVYANMPPGQMYYSITYGKNLMGSYAAQVSPFQRWMIVNYIKNFQSKTVSAAQKTPAAGKDTAATKPVPAMSTTPATQTKK